MIRIPVVTAVLRAALACGCATSPDAIKPARVSSEPYLQQDCEQLAAEYARIGASLKDAQEVQTDRAQQDSAAVAVAVLLFRPAVAGLQGDRSMAGEVARFKGERIAIENAMARKNCDATRQFK